MGTPRTQGLDRFTFTQYHMGIDARIVVYAPTQPAAEKAAASAFARIAELDSIMSDYRRDSELMKLCDRAGGPAVKISPDLAAVFARADEVWRRSDGAFDVTVGPLVGLWRQARRSGQAPTEEQVAQARSLVGWRHVRVDRVRRKAQLALPGMKLDLGGIAKGYAADEAMKTLRRLGIDRALIELGGDIVVGAPPPGAAGWTIRVPNAAADRGPADLQFSRCAISTSGDTEQFTMIGGVRYSHVVDPRTGRPLTNRVQATIVAKDGLTSDPLSTAATILDEKGRLRLLASYPGVRCYVRTASD